MVDESRLFREWHGLALTVAPFARGTGATGCGCMQPVPGHRYRPAAARPTHPIPTALLILFSSSLTPSCYSFARAVVPLVEPFPPVRQPAHSRTHDYRAASQATPSRWVPRLPSMASALVDSSGLLGATVTKCCACLKSSGCSCRVASRCARARSLLQCHRSECCARHLRGGASAAI